MVLIVNQGKSIIETGNPAKWVNALSQAAPFPFTD
jgi:hypothetical protein